MPFNDDDDGWLVGETLSSQARPRPTRGCCCFGMHLNLVLLLNLFEGEGERKGFLLHFLLLLPFFCCVHPRSFEFFLLSAGAAAAGEEGRVIQSGTRAVI